MGRVQRLEKVISVCLLASAALLVVVGAGASWLPGSPGATGRVYGTVYSGLDLGFCLSAPVFGAMLDHGMTSGIFFGSAATLALSVVSAALVGVGLAARMARPAGVTVG